jgi:uncharacterized integral membrane protein
VNPTGRGRLRIIADGSPGGPAMLRRIFILFVLAPLFLVLIGFAVANHEPVTVSFDPFSATNPAFVLEIRLYLLALGLLTVGVIVGGVAAWLTHLKWRRAARKFEAENRALRTELDSFRRRFGLAPRTTLPATIDETPHAMLRSPAA